MIPIVIAAFFFWLSRGTFAAFIDFEKAFDSPPRGALFEVLEWIGCPPDLLAMVQAIHEDPKGKIFRSAVWFRVVCGIQQGCDAWAYNVYHPP